MSGLGTFENRPPDALPDG